VPQGGVGAGASASEEPAGPWGYRDKVSFVFAPAGRQPLVMGHYRRGTRNAFAAGECPVHAEAGNEMAFRLRDALVRAGVPAAAPDGRNGIARHVVVRVAEGTGDRLATLVVTENVVPLRRVTADMERFGRTGGRLPDTRFGFHLNLHDRADGFLFGPETKRLFGPMEVRETLAGVTFLLSPTSFFQTNVRIAALMVDHVLRLLPPDACPRVLDLYSGVGLFALPLARRGQEVTAVEENRHAVAAADAAVRFNRLPESLYRPVSGRVESAMSRLTPRLGDRGWDAVVLDPPRQGCPPAVLDWVFRTLRPRLAVYVSCNPQALATDLAAIPRDYTVAEITPYDMFPHTAHIEAIASIVLKSES
jgi:23S rRNA (uracil-5-)-methyltransferase RumA